MYRPRTHLETHEPGRRRAGREANGYPPEQRDSNRPFAGIAVALANFLSNKRCATIVHPAMACVGGPGRVEEGPMPLYCREAPLNWIWEGLGKACVVTRLASESGRVAEPWPDRLDRAAILAGVAA